MQTYTLIIRAKKGGTGHDIKRTIHLQFIPTIGMEFRIDYSTKENGWSMKNEDPIFVQVTNIICFLDDENSRVEEPIQIYAALAQNHSSYRLNDLEKWWEHLDAIAMQNSAHELANYEM